MVNARYSITARRLQVVDHDRAKGEVRCLAHAGSDNYQDIAKQGIGLLPPGAYGVYFRAAPYAGHPAYVLDPVDDRPLNDHWDDRADDNRRASFRIHIALPNLPNFGSKGCIVLNNDDLQRLKQFCDATVPGPVETVRSSNDDGTCDEFTNPLIGTLVVEC